ncbi:hypothetical protein Poli38472_002780 [Pythium oligandrum]|uniref:GRIP domain-containing protein n=1 Tax=Pythium oligandrum TaxID=41045 RepID=A0A8K1FK55_PYTOL|nr:hypothetical protein Poli38472_002780 [Pythium oligandrum]|eukprot:TMW63839.1 hypothetical protein Poli38472_002780 [Pythium oligandrum]
MQRADGWRASTPSLRRAATLKQVVEAVAMPSRKSGALSWRAETTPRVHVRPATLDVFEKAKAELQIELPVVVEDKPEKTSRWNGISRLLSRITAAETEKSASEETTTTKTTAEASASTDFMSVVMKEVQRVRAMRARAEASSVGLQERLARTEEQLAQATQDVRQKTALVGSLEAKVSQLTDELRRLSSADVHVEIEELRTRKQELEDELAGLRQGNTGGAGVEELTRELEAARAREVELQTELSQKEALGAARDQQLRNLELLRNAKNAELDRLLLEKSDAMEQLTAALTARDDLMAQSEVLRDELDQEKQRSSTLEARLTELTSELEALSAELAETKTALSFQTALASRLQSENIGLTNQHAELVERVETLLRDVALSKEAEEESEAKVKSTMEVMEQIRAERDEAARRITELSQELERQKAHWSDLLEEQSDKLKAELATEQEARRIEVEQIQSESEAMTELAAQALFEKENEVEQLSARLNELEGKLRAEVAQHRMTKDTLEEKLWILRQESTQHIESLMAQLTGSKKQVSEHHDDMNMNVEALIQGLEAAIQHSEDLVAQLAEKDKELDEMHASRKALKSEVTELRDQLTAMESGLRLATDGVETYVTQAEEAEQRRRQAEEKLTRARMEMDAIHGQHKKQLELLRGEKDAELERVQSEKSSVTKQLVVANAARARAEGEMRGVKTAMERLLTEREEAAREVQSLKADAEREKTRLTEQLETQAKEYQVSLDTEKKAFRKELDRVENESKVKAKLALRAMQEKDAEIERMAKRLDELEAEVKTGESDSQQILEFAQLQANREMEARANAARIEALDQELAAARTRIQELQQEKAKHRQEVVALTQTQRRGDVNIEYLKNVMVQYMTLKGDSAQQARLVPLITNLLQLTPTEIKEIEKANRRGASWVSWAA